MNAIAPGWGTLPAIRATRTGWTSRLAELAPLVQLGTLTLVTRGATPGTGSASIIGAVDMDGWDDDAADATETVPHWSGDGVVASSEHRYGARTITIRGFISGHSVADVARAKNRVKREARGLLSVNEHFIGLTREADTRRVGLIFKRVTPLFTTFTLTLLAEDPLRYAGGSRVLAAGANTIPNGGDEDASPVLTATGPLAATTITHDGGAFTLSAVASGVTRIHDLRNGDVWQGGVRVHGTESGPPPVVRAGGASWTVAGLGAGTLGAARTEAWS